MKDRRPAHEQAGTTAEAAMIGYLTLGTDAFFIG
jgi:hypothetical protein